MASQVQVLKPLLQSLLDGSISKNELSEFVQLTRAIIQSHFEYLRSSITSLCSHQGLTITDVAYDCIADAFARDENDRFPQLENFVDSLGSEMEKMPERELYLAFKGFVTRIADAQLARLYAQADPSGAKIHRNIRDCLKHSKLFSLHRDFRGLVLCPYGSDALEELEPAPVEQIENGLLSLAGRHSSTVELLKALHDVLTKQSSYRRSMSLIDVVQLFKKVYRYDVEVLDEEAYHPSLDGLTEFEVDQIRSEVELALKEKILLTYFARGKVDRKEAEAMFNAFHDILWDWCSSGDLQVSLYQYYCRHFPIDEKTYETTSRSKMEYLLKIAREEFAARLMREI